MESSIFVFCYGSDNFMIRTAPDKTFDMIMDDFNYLVLLLILVVGTVVIVIFSRQLKLAKLKKPHLEWSIKRSIKLNNNLCIYHSSPTEGFLGVKLLELAFFLILFRLHIEVLYAQQQIIWVYAFILLQPRCLLFLVDLFYHWPAWGLERLRCKRTYLRQVGVWRIDHVVEEHIEVVEVWIVLGGSGREKQIGGVWVV